MEIPAPTATVVISITRGELVVGDRCNLVIFIARVEGDGGDRQERREVRRSLVIFIASD
jgi:hypothetical protein